MGNSEEEYILSSEHLYITEFTENKGLFSELIYRLKLYIYNDTIFYRFH